MFLLINRVFIPFPNNLFSGDIMANYVDAVTGLVAFLAGAAAYTGNLPAAGLAFATFGVLYGAKGLTSK